jgi:hypothetical protein
MMCGISCSGMAGCVSSDDLDRAAMPICLLRVAPVPADAAVAAFFGDMSPGAQSCFRFGKARETAQEQS